ncbi:MAG TPA: hypothetical protein VEU62_07265 [Bryobacterales bacterium]|nr:hypothetical protein [Bryobacterales bacterium]
MKNQIRRLSATRAARDFSRLLDRIQSGGEAVIERHSPHPVAILGPAAVAPRRISECLAVPLARPSAAVDRAFASDVAKVIKTHPRGRFPRWE